MNRETYTQNPRFRDLTYEQKRYQKQFEDLVTSGRGYDRNNLLNISAEDINTIKGVRMALENMHSQDTGPSITMIVTKNEYTAYNGLDERTFRESEERRSRIGF